MSIVIKVENLGKKYIIRHRQRERYRTLRDELTKGVKTALSGKKKTLPPKEDFWALKDVSFEVNQGEKLGIIGRNGAGKTTLLKVLSRITDPSSGKVGIKGRIASLLEVGTGFHPELTGRENIFLNGSILGMSRSEIKSKFDEIVDFAETERFLDTPVKRYSSGMYVRLAFAVAAHLEPEILMIDEVLAVGDVQFQKKCLGKMQDVAGEGRTVLFVSHNMAAISNLCSSVMVLKDGGIDFRKGNTQDAIQHYLADAGQHADSSLKNRRNRSGEGNIRLTDFTIIGNDGQQLQTLVSGQSVRFRIQYECIDNPDPKNVMTALSITRSDGFLVTVLNNELSSGNFESIKQKGVFYCELKKLPLMSGTYLVNLMVRQNNIIQDWLQEAQSFSVENGDFYGTGRVVEATHNSILFEHQWTQE